MQSNAMKAKWLLVPALVLVGLGLFADSVGGPTATPTATATSDGRTVAEATSVPASESPVTPAPSVTQSASNATSTPLRQPSLEVLP